MKVEVTFSCPSCEFRQTKTVTIIYGQTKSVECGNCEDQDVVVLKVKES